MSSSYFGINSSKSRRSSPGEPQGVLFQTGQGPAYSNQYTPRSSPARYELNQQALYNHWPSNISTEPTSSFSNYETHDRYSNQPLYNFPVRTSPIPSNVPDSRKLPPLSTSPGWSYPSASSNYQNGSSIVRSPTAAYPAEYTYSTHAGSYTYLPTQDHDHVHIPSMNHAVHVPSFESADYPRTENQRSSSPYGRNTSHLVPRSSTPPPISPTSGPEETTTKKKRKRADANQLKVLNETYNRTAFPSTEERLALAKLLDMSPRSVQIWFQNKRQSMRQTNRQSTVGSASQPLVVSSRDIPEDPTQMGYHLPIALGDAPYTSRPPTDAPRSHAPQSSSHRRVRHHEEAVEHRKWPSVY